MAGGRRRSSGDGAAIDGVWRGVEQGDVAELHLVDRLDDDALRVCRVLSSALRTGAPWTVVRAAAPVAVAVGDRLAELLHSASPADPADPFLALAHLGDRYADGRAAALRRARVTAGPAHVDRFLRSVASVAPRAVAAHEVASDGLRLEPAAHASRSRLGGTPLLSQGTAWPASDAGNALTFLAAIDLGELSPSQIASVLPAAGWLLFVADLGTGEGDGLEEALNVPGAAARVFAVDDPVQVELPVALREEDRIVLHERRVAFRRVLTLPGGHDAAGRLGLDVYEGQAYEELWDRLAEAIGDRGSEHWIGGHATGVQGQTPEDGSLLLLHIEDDAELGFHCRR